MNDAKQTIKCFKIHFDIRGKKRRESNVLEYLVMRHEHACADETTGVSSRS